MAQRNWKGVGMTMVAVVGAGVVLMGLSYAMNKLLGTNPPVYLSVPVTSGYQDVKFP